MRVLRFVKDGRVRLGLSTGKGVVDVAAAASGTGLPVTMEELISQGQAGLDRLRGLETTVALLDESSLDYAPVVARPEKIVCIGWNYVSHIEETKTRTDLPKYPEVFAVANSGSSCRKLPRRTTMRPNWSW